jgi:hypothetical protein
MCRSMFVLAYTVSFCYLKSCLYTALGESSSGGHRSPMREPARATASSSNTRLPFSFLILRYATFVAIIPSLWFTTLQTSSCQLAVTLSEGGVVLIAASSGIIFANRVVAVWAADARVAALVGALYIAMATCWVCYPKRARGEPLADPTSLWFMHTRLPRRRSTALRRDLRRPWACSLIAS